MRKRPGPHILLLAPLLGLVAGCAEVVDNVPPRPAAIEEPAMAAAPFPALAAVPARPRLGYTLEQRRAIAEGLVADRANARHAGDDLRQALDRPARPDTAPPLPPLPAAPQPRRDDGADLALAYAEEALARDSDDGSLGDFLERLQQPPPGVEEVRPAAAAGPVAGEGAGPSTAPAVPLPEMPPPASEPTARAVPDDPAAAAVPPAQPRAAPLPTAAAEVAPAAAAAAERVERTAPVAAPPAEPALPLAILFAADTAALDDDHAVELRGVARRVAAASGAVVVSGGGRRPGLAMERARRVAAALVGGGLPPAQIAIEMGGESDVVVVYEAGA